MLINFITKCVGRGVSAPFFGPTFLILTGLLVALADRSLWQGYGGEDVTSVVR